MLPLCCAAPGSKFVCNDASAEVKFGRTGLKIKEALSEKASVAFVTSSWGCRSPAKTKTNVTKKSESVDGANHPSSATWMSIPIKTAIMTSAYTTLKRNSRLFVWCYSGKVVFYKLYK